MSYLAQCLAALADVAGPLAETPSASAEVKAAAVEVGRASDIVPAAQAMVNLIVAVEDTVAELDYHAKKLRAKLAEVLDETGAPSIRTKHHTVFVSEGRSGVVITDQTAIPPHLMRQPPAQPDKAAIAKLLSEGVSVPGVVLGNRAPSLTIRKR